MHVAMTSTVSPQVKATRASTVYAPRRMINVPIKHNARSGTNASRVNARRLARQTLIARLDMLAT
jgi:hypothetical protein